MTAPAPKSYVRDEDGEGDFAIMSYSGRGDVSGAITVTEDFGCDTADFTGVSAGDVALVERGECTFYAKAANAEEAGAAAVIVYNADEPVFYGTLGQPTPGEIPAIGVSRAVGLELIELDEAGGETVHLVADTLIEHRTSSNLFAETPDGDDTNVVMAGAHLDSVPEGPGINDNATGAVALLQTALHLAESDAPIHNTVRFAWWGAEESGLVGSWDYVENVLYDAAAEDLSDEGNAVALYLNFDMVGSPNFARFVYDGDGSAFEIGDPGSGVIEAGFEDVFDALGLAHEPTEFSGRSDYAGFQALGIPTGGLFTGAEVVKTEEQVALYGGTAGEAFDSCYHQACDDLDNVNEQVFEEMLYAIAHEIYRYALSTADVDNAQAQAAKVQARARTSASSHPRSGHDWIR